MVPEIKCRIFSSFFSICLLSVHKKLKLMVIKLVVRGKYLSVQY